MTILEKILVAVNRLVNPNPDIETIRQMVLEVRGAQFAQETKLEAIHQDVRLIVAALYPPDSEDDQAQINALADRVGTAAESVQQQNSALDEAIEEAQDPNH